MTREQYIAVVEAMFLLYGGRDGLEFAREWADSMRGQEELASELG